MTLAHVKTLIANGESASVEFKKSTGQLTRAAETLCAFLNGDGGTVLFGVANDGSVLGQLVSDDTLRDVAQILRRIEPPVAVGIDRIKLPGSRGEVLALSVSPDDDSRVFALDGRAYQRVGSTTQVMPQETYQRLLMNRTHSHKRWENSASPIHAEDLDLSELRATVRMGIEFGRVPSTASAEAGDILDRFGLRLGETLTNAAAVLFAKHESAHYPQCQLRLARFRGIDKNEFLDQRQLNGNAFHLLTEAVQFMNRHLPVSGRIEPGVFERVDAPLCPPVALREALVNAFVHRDYSIPGGAVSVAIYDDRLEIWSDGRLPFGLTVEALAKEHLSRPRNPLIAEVFFRRGLVERWGRGTQKIIELCVLAGHPTPQFLEQAGAVGVRFLPSGYIAPLRVAHDLTNRQRLILQILSASAQQTFGNIKRQVNPDIADRTLRDDLLHLKRLLLIDSIGRGRGATWSLRGSRPE
jgi:ATP-dependent DNA helicase RecG